MNTMHTSTPRDPQRCAAPRRLHRRLSGVFRRLHGGLLCALLVALVVGLAPAMTAPAAHADTTIDPANWMAQLNPSCSQNLSSSSCQPPSSQCNTFPYTGCDPIDLPLNELAIPGTHDTGTYSIPAQPPMCSDLTFAPDLGGDTGSLNHYTNCPPAIIASLIWLVPIPGALLAATIGVLTGVVAADVLRVSSTYGPYVNALPALARDALFTGIAPAFTKFAQSQDQDVTQMLNGGIRYFDLRVCGSSDGPRICHSIYGAPIMDLVDQVHTWTAAHPKEVVILDFNHFYAMSQDDENSLANTIVNTFGSSLVPPGAPSDLNLRLLWRQGENVIVSYQDGQVHANAQGLLEPLWSSMPAGLPPSAYVTGANEFTNFLWGNTYDSITMDADAQNALTSRCSPSPPASTGADPCPDAFFTYSLQLTPSGDDIVNGLTSNDSLQAAAARSNPCVIPDFFKTAISTPLLQRSVSIVGADFYENSNLVTDTVRLDEGEGPIDSAVCVGTTH